MSRHFLPVLQPDPDARFTTGLTNGSRLPVIEYFLSSCFSGFGASGVVLAAASGALGWLGTAGFAGADFAAATLDAAAGAAAVFAATAEVFVGTRTCVALAGVTFTAALAVGAALAFTGIVAFAGAAVAGTAFAVAGVSVGLEELVCADTGFSVAPLAAGAFADTTAGFAAGAAGAFAVTAGVFAGIAAAFTGAVAGFVLAWLEAVAGFAGVDGLVVLACTEAGFAAPGLAVVAGEGFPEDVAPNAWLLAAVCCCCTPCTASLVFWIMLGFCAQAVPAAIASATMPVVSFIESPTFSPEPGRVLPLPLPDRGHD
jgi:hypothetical protein